MTNMTKKLFMLASFIGMAVVMSGCTCPSKQHMHHQQHVNRHETHHGKQHKQKMQSPQITETVVFYQTYDVTDIDSVNANMYTRSSRGGESAMGTVKFQEKEVGFVENVTEEHAIMTARAVIPHQWQLICHNYV